MSRCLHSLCSYNPPPGAVAHPPHPLGFLITVLLGSGPQGPCGLESKPASWERQNSFQPLAPPAHPGPDSGVGSLLLGLILPRCPPLSSDELPGAGLHFLDTWQCLCLPPPFFLAPTWAFAATFTCGSLCVFKVWAQIWFYAESQNLLLCEDSSLQAKRRAGWRLAALEEAASEPRASPRIRSKQLQLREVTPAHGPSPQTAPPSLPDTPERWQVSGGDCPHRERVDLIFLAWPGVAAEEVEKTEQFMFRV